MAWIPGKNGETRFAFDVYKNSLNYEILGDKEDVIELEQFLEKEGFDSEGVKIKWMYGSDYRNMDSLELPLSLMDGVEGTYPWMTKTIEEYTLGFMASRSSVLILIGPPGTGKTTFIKEIIRNSGTGAMVTYDTDLLFTDGFFASFMADEDTDLLILEDADVVMKSRKEGNSMMHKFLNASDGLVSLPRKKIIFTTNLPSVKDVDDALLRKGRCFDVMQFRLLTKEEASVVSKNYYGEKQERNLD
jgi:DNA polymerase III delta prime subunit